MIQEPHFTLTKYIFFQIDSGGTGSIDFPEFLAYVAKKQRESSEDPVLNLLGFTYYDFPAENLFHF